METRQIDKGTERPQTGTIEPDSLASYAEGPIFEIHVKGHLNNHWSDWLDRLEMKRLDNGEMILFGSIVDQAALIGVLNKLYRLNLALISVNKVNQKDRLEEK